MSWLLNEINASLEYIRPRSRFRCSHSRRLRSEPVQVRCPSAASTSFMIVGTTSSAPETMSTTLDPRDLPSRTPRGGMRSSSRGPSDTTGAGLLSRTSSASVLRPPPRSSRSWTTETIRVSMFSNRSTSRTGIRT